MTKSLDTIFASSDLHLGHKNVLKYDGRPFDDIETHDAAIETNFLSVMPRGSTLILVGDIAIESQWKKGVEFILKLKQHGITTILVKGNHDKQLLKKTKNDPGLFHMVRDVLFMSVEDYQFFFSHYSHRVWPNSQYGSIYAYGHSHGALPQWGRSTDVCVNQNGYKPLKLREIVEMVSHHDPIHHHVPETLPTPQVSHCNFNAVHGI